jgi:predicted phosphodiesterase
MSTDEIRPQVKDVDTDLIIVGHTHVPYKIEVDDKLIVNPGSISNHLDDDKRAKYAILHADEKGYKIEFYRVAYDVEKVIAILDEIDHPAKELIKNYLKN